MGLCISRRAVDASGYSDLAQQQSEELASGRHKRSAEDPSAEVMNRARMLLESPRISTDISEMGMLGLLFHKRYCGKSLPSQPNPGGCYKLAPDAVSSEQPVLVMQQNALFEEQRQERDELLREEEDEVEDPQQEDDGYPAFQPNPMTPSLGLDSSKLTVVAAAIKQECIKQECCSSKRGVWQSAGEEFFSDWEDRSHAAAPAPAPVTPPPPPPAELGVFEAEEYFKEDPLDPPKSEATTSLDPLSANAEQQQPQQQHSSSPSRSSSCSSSGAGARWASLCAGSSVVEVSHKGKKSAKSMKNKAENHISKMLKLLASPSSSPPPQPSPGTSMVANSGARKYKKKGRIAENHVKEWMDRARKSIDVSQKDAKGSVSPAIQEQAATLTRCQRGGFGSPFPASPRNNSSDTNTAIAKEDDRDQQQGNDSDSSSDLFELDSVTTSLSSARSSLSRLSSARSSVRKSTVDEQDMLHMNFVPAENKVTASDQINPCKKNKQHKNDELEPRVLATSSAAGCNASNASVLIMKTRRHSSKITCLDSGPLLSIVEESKPSGGNGGGARTRGLNSWSSNSVLAVQT